jgi:uncharacterized RDD family membrane protein YckC
MMNDPNRMYAPPGTPTGAPAEMLPVTTNYADFAGFGVRAAARIIDTLFLMVPGFIAGALAGAISAIAHAASPAAAGRSHAAGGLSASSLLVGALATVVYHALSEGVGGASVGKLALGLRVRRSDLSQCSVGAAIGRSLAYYVDALFFGMVAYGSMSKSLKQQRLGDKWAHTVVVKNASLPAGAPAANVGLGIALGTIAHAVLSTVGELWKLML